jgi:Tfp pilus assembly protein PilN
VLRTNLSTRPFYNERAVHALIAVLAAIVLLVTLFQVARVISLSREKTELTTAIHRDQQESEQRTREAAAIRRGMNQQELATVAAAAREANDLIEQRTFSWTQLFNQLEATLPENVMLTAVRPQFKDGATHVNMDIQGRRTEDIDAFFEKLEQTGAFHDVQWSAESITEEGLHHMTMTAVYTPDASGVRSVGTGSKR